jgi:hypothetical protein
MRTVLRTIVAVLIAILSLPPASAQLAKRPPGEMIDSFVLACTSKGTALKLVAGIAYAYRNYPEEKAIEVVNILVEKSPCRSFIGINDEFWKQKPLSEEAFFMGKIKMRTRAIEVDVPVRKTTKKAYVVMIGVEADSILPRA